MRAWRGTIGLIAAVWTPVLTFAGHGFMTAFGNIEWLPEPGRTPDSPWYQLDTWQEEGQLLLARAPEEKIRLCLTFAREKLAELEATVASHKLNAAEQAGQRYRAYIERAWQILRGELVDKEPSVELIANALLEHQYILSILYTDLPVGARAAVPPVITVAREYYTEVADLLPPKKKGALFFKEEEVRWSVHMATRVDENGAGEGEDSSQ
jgi:hypothetical protein